MSALGRCARLCLSRLAHLPRTHILHQTKKNNAFIHLKPQVTTVSFNFSRHFQAVVDEREPGVPRRTKNPIGDLDIFLNRYGRITTYNINESFSHFDQYGMANVHDGFKVLRFTGQPICDLNPSKRMELTERAWKYIEDSGFQLGTSAFNNLLLVYLENDHKFSPPDFLATMEEKGVKPNKVTYQLVLAAYCSEGDIENASHILQQMKDENLETSDVVFNSLITGHFKAKDKEGAISILDLMRQSGLEPTNETYSTFIQGYAAIGDLDSLKKTIEEAFEMKVALRPYQICDSVLTAVENGHNDLAFEILEILTSREMRFFQDIKTVLFQMVAKGYVDEAFQIQEKVFQDYNIDGPGINYLVRTIIHNLSTDEYADLVRKHISRIKKPIIVYDLIKYSYYCNRIDWALKVIELANQEGLEIRPHMYFPAYVQHLQNNNKQGLAHVIKELVKINPKWLALDHLRREVIPVMLRNGENVEDFLLNILKAEGVPQEIGESAYFRHIIGPDPEKASEFSKDKHIIDFRYAAQDRIGWDIQKHWKEYLKLLSKFKDLNATAKEIMMLALSAEVDTRENILTYCSSLGYSLDPKLSDGLQVGGHLDEEPAYHKRHYDMKIEELQAICNEDQNAKAAKIVLFGKQVEAKDIEGARKTFYEMEADGVFPTGRFYKNSFLIFCSCHEKDLSMSLKYLTLLETDHPDFCDYKLGLINTCTLLIDAGRFEDAKSHIQLYIDRHASVHHYQRYPNSFCLLGGSIGRNIEPKEAIDLVEKMTDSGFLQASYLLLDEMLKGYINRGDNDMIVEVVQLISTREKLPRHIYLDVMSYFVEKEDSENLQKIVDISHSNFGESYTVLNLMTVLIEQNKLPQARELSENPNLKAGSKSIEVLLQRAVKLGKLNNLKDMISIFKELRGADRDLLYFYLMKFYVGVNNYQAAKDVLMNYEEDGILPSARTLLYLAEKLKSVGMEVDFYCPKEPEKENKPVKQEPASKTELKKDHSNKSKKKLKEDQNKNSKTELKEDHSKNSKTELKEDHSKNSIEEDIKLYTKRKQRFDDMMMSERFQDEDRVKEFLKICLSKDHKRILMSPIWNHFSSRENMSMINYMIEETLTTRRWCRFIGNRIAKSYSSQMIDMLDLQSPERRDAFLDIYVLESLKENDITVHEKVIDLIKQHPTGISYQNLWSHQFETNPEEAIAILQEASDDLKNKMKLRPLGKKLLRKKNEKDLYKLIELAKENFPDQVLLLYEHLIQFYVEACDIEKTNQVVKQVTDEGFYDQLNKTTRSFLKRIHKEYNEKPDQEVSDQQITGNESSNQTTESSSSSDSHSITAPQPV